MAYSADSHGLTDRPFAEVVWVAMDFAIQRVALNRLTPCLLDQLLYSIDGQNFRSRGTGIMINQLVANRAVDVIGTVMQGNLSRLDA